MACNEIKAFLYKNFALSFQRYHLLIIILLFPILAVSLVKLIIRKDHYYNGMSWTLGIDDELNTLFSNFHRYDKYSPFISFVGKNTNEDFLESTNVPPVFQEQCAFGEIGSLPEELKELIRSAASSQWNGEYDYQECKFLTYQSVEDFLSNRSNSVMLGIYFRSYEKYTYEDDIIYTYYNTTYGYDIIINKDYYKSKYKNIKLESLIYIKSGYIYLQKLIYDYILKKTTGNDSAEVNFKLIFKNKIGNLSEKELNDSYCQHEDYEYILQIIFMSVYYIPLIAYTYKFVKDKKTNMPLIIRGYSIISYYFASFIQFICLNIIYAVIFSLIMICSFDTEFSINFGLFFLFGLTIFGLAFLTESIGFSIKMSFLISSFIYTLMWIGFFPSYEKKYPSKNSDYSIFLASPIALGFGLNSVLKKVFHSDTQVDRTNLSFAYGFFVIDFVIYLFIGIIFKIVAIIIYKKRLFKIEKFEVEEEEEEKTTDEGTPIGSGGRIIEEKPEEEEEEIIFKFEGVSISQKEQSKQPENSEQPEHPEHPEQPEHTKQPEQPENREQPKHPEQPVQPELKLLEEVNLSLCKEEINILSGDNKEKAFLLNFLTGNLEMEGKIFAQKGEEIKPVELRKLISTIPEVEELYDELTINNHIRFVCYLNGVDFNKSRVKIFNYLSKLGLAKFLYKKISELSYFQKRKLCLLLCLLKKSNVYIIKEPTKGLDNNEKKLVWELLINQRNKRCIVVSTSDTEEGKFLGNNIIFLKSKKIKKIPINITSKGSLDSAKDRVSCTIYLKKNVAPEQIIDTIGEKGGKNLEFESMHNKIKINFFGNTCLNDSLPDEKDYQKEGKNPTSTQIIELFDNELKSKVENFEVSYYDDNSLLKLYDKEENSKEVEFKSSGYDSFLFSSFKKSWYLLFSHHKCTCSIFALIVPPIISAACVLIIYFTYGKSSWNYYSTEYFTDIVYKNLSNSDIESIFMGSRLRLEELYSDKFWQWQYYYYRQNYKYMTKELTYCSIDMNSRGLFYGYLDVPEYKFEDGYEFEYKSKYDAYKKHRYNEESYQNLRDKYKCFFCDRTIGFLLTKQDWDNKQFNFTEILEVDDSDSIIRATDMILKSIISYTNRREGDYSEKIVKTPFSEEYEGIDGFRKVSKYSLYTSLFIFISSFIIIPILLTSAIVKEESQKIIYYLSLFKANLFTYYGSMYIFDIVVCLAVTLVISLIAVSFDSFPKLFSIPCCLFVFSYVAFNYLLCHLFKSSGSLRVVTLIINIMFGIFFPTFMFFIGSNGDPGISYSIIRYIGPFVPSYALGKSYEFMFISRYDESFEIYNEKWSNGVLKGETEDLLYLGLSIIVYNGILLFIILNKRRASRLLESGDDEDQSKYNVIYERVQSGERLGSEVSVEKEVIISMNGVTKYKTVCCCCCKKWKKQTLKVLNLVIENGETYGIVGKSNSGKSKLIDLFLSKSQKFEGNLKTSLMVNSVGYCPQYFISFDYLTVKQNLEYFASLKRIGNQNDSIKNYLKDLHLYSKADEKVGNLEYNNRKKLNFLISIMGSPKVLILDDLFSGLKKEDKDQIRDVLRTYKKQKKITIIVTALSFEDIEDLCDNFFIMTKGSLGHLMTKEMLNNKYKGIFELHVVIKKLSDSWMEEELSKRELTKNDIFDFKNKKEQLGKLGKKNYDRLINPNRLGRDLYMKILEKGHVKIKDIFNFIYYTNKAINLLIMVVRTYKVKVKLISFTENKFLFEIKSKNNLTVSEIYQNILSNLKQFFVEEFSIRKKNFDCLIKEREMQKVVKDNFEMDLNIDEKLFD